jgi:hypothetical protein
MKRVVLASIVLLGLLPWAAGAAFDGLEAKQVATRDPAHLVGAFHALAATPSPSAASASLEASGDLTLWVDGVDDPNTVLAQPVQPKEVHDRHTFAEATVTTLAVRANASVFLVPLDGPSATLRTEGVELGPSTSAAASPSWKVRAEPERASLQVPVEGLVEARASAGSVMELSGDFLLVLWDWDLSVRSPGGDEDFGSGERYRETVPPTAGVRTVASYSRHQLTLLVEDGTLRLALPPGWAGTLHLPTGTLSTAGVVVLEKATGPLDTPAGRVELSQSRLELAGDVVAQLQAAGSGLHVTLEGEPRSVMADGKVASTLVQPPAPFPWLAAVGGAALLALPPGAWVARRARDGRRARELEDAMACGEYDRAAQIFAPLVRVRRHRSQALLLGALSLIRLRKMGEAERLLEDEQAWRDNAPGILPYLRAHVAAEKGAWDAAQHQLVAAVAAAPSLGEEISANPVFAPLLQDPELRRRLGLPLVEGYT